MIKCSLLMDQKLERSMTFFLWVVTQKGIPRHRHQDRKGLGGASMLFLKYGYLQLRKQLKCACSKVKSSAYFSMGPTHGHWQNLWRKSSMARIHVMLRKVRNMSWKDKVTNNFPYGSNPRVTEIINENDLVWLVKCQDTMSQLAEFCCGNLISGEEWVTPKLP